MHLTLDVLADYFAETLSTTREETVEVHLANCARCAALARRVHAVDERVRRLLDGWTAASHRDTLETPAEDGAERMVRRCR